jgi:hypothetical protein
MRSAMKNSFSLVLAAVLFATVFVSGQSTNATRYPFLLLGDLPLYPAVAKTARVSGVVQVQVTVKNGEVAGTEAISGNPLLSSAAIDNIKTWKFGKDVSTTFRTTFIYRLEKQETAEPSNPKLELELPKMAKITARPTRRPCHDCGSDMLPRPVTHSEPKSPVLPTPTTP